MTIKAILTSLKGVELPYERRRTAETLSREVFLPQDTDEIDHILHGPEGLELLHRLESGAMIDEEYMHALETRLGTPLPRNLFWPAHCDVFTEPNHALMGHWRGIAERGMPVVAITDSDPYALSTMLGLITFPVARVMASCYEGTRKPDERIYRHALELLKMRPAECFYVDDVEANAMAAARLGIWSHHYRTLPLLEEELRGLNLIT